MPLSSLLGARSHSLLPPGMGHGPSHVSMIMATAWASLRWLDRWLTDEDLSWQVCRTYGMDEPIVTRRKRADAVSHSDAPRMVGTSP